MLSLTDDVAARFEASANNSGGGGRAQYRSIAKEVGVQPRIFGLWRHRYADHGLEGLKDKPQPGKQPIYTKATDKRILKLLDKPPPEGFARWTGPLLAAALGDFDVQYIWRFLRSHDVVGPTSPHPLRPLCCAWTRSPQSRPWSGRKATSERSPEFDTMKLLQYVTNNRLKCAQYYNDIVVAAPRAGAVAELVGIRVGVVSGVMNLESSGVEASDWRPRHDQGYHQV